MRHFNKIFVSLLGALVAVSTSKAEVWTVQMTDKPPYFQPAHLKINLGDSVVWKNSGPELPHIVITEDQTIYSDDVSVHSEWSHTFSHSGIYSYLCFRHFFMRGTVEVTKVHSEKL